MRCRDTTYERWISGFFQTLSSVTGWESANRTKKVNWNEIKPLLHAFSTRQCMSTNVSLSSAYWWHIIRPIPTRNEFTPHSIHTYTHTHTEYTCRLILFARYCRFLYKWNGSHMPSNQMFYRDSRRCFFCFSSVFPFFHFFSVLLFVEKGSFLQFVIVAQSYCVEKYEMNGLSYGCAHMLGSHSEWNRMTEWNTSVFISFDYFISFARSTYGRIATGTGDTLLWGLRNSVFNEWRRRSTGYILQT